LCESLERLKTDRKIIPSSSNAASSSFSFGTREGIKNDTFVMPHGTILHLNLETCMLHACIILPEKKYVKNES
jgi:hypothetical protein